MSRTPKAQTQRRHAQRRAYERHGLQLTRHDLNEIVRQIQAGKAHFVERQSHRVSLFDIDIDGRSARVVYDKQRKTIVSFLPAETESSL